jgi:site-specific recombinase XerD
MTNNEIVMISEAIQKFLDQLAVGKQPFTVKAYAVALRRFSQFLADEQSLPSDMPAENITVNHAIEFAKSLQKLAPATIRNYLAALSEFYRYAFAHRLILVDAADHQRLFTSLKQMRPRSFSLPHVPPDDVMEMLLRTAAAEESANGKKQNVGDLERTRLRRLRDSALLLSLKSSGMRLGEALALRRGDLDYRNKSAVVTGKGRKQRVVYFDEKAWNAIQAYLQARQDGSHVRTLAQVPVFVRHDRRVGKELLPMTRQRVEQIFKSLADRLQIDPRPTPHWFRHWFATQVLEQTQDLAALQDMLGHESPVTTRIYAKVSTKRLRQVHDATFGNKDTEK